LSVVIWHGQLLRVAVSQLVHCALVVVGHMLAVALSAVTFVDVNNKSATTTAIQKWLFFHFFLQRVSELIVSLWYSFVRYLGTIV